MEPSSSPERKFYTLGPQPPYGSEGGRRYYEDTSFWYYRHDQFWSPEVEYYNPYLEGIRPDNRYWQYLLNPKNGVHLHALLAERERFYWTGDPHCNNPQRLLAPNERQDIKVMLESGTSFDPDVQARYRWMAIAAPRGEAEELLRVVGRFRRLTTGFGWYVAAYVQRGQRWGPPAQDRYYWSWIDPEPPSARHWLPRPPGATDA